MVAIKTNSCCALSQIFNICLEVKVMFGTILLSRIEQQNANTAMQLFANMATPQIFKNILPFTNELHQIVLAVHQFQVSFKRRLTYLEPKQKLSLIVLLTSVLKTCVHLALLKMLVSVSSFNMHGHPTKYRKERRFVN